MIKIKKKDFIFFAIVFTLLSSLVFGPRVYRYFEWKQIAKAVSGMPWQDGGKIAMVREPCIWDTPASSPVTCAISCPLVTKAVGSMCTGYIELDLASQLGTTFVAAPVGFVYSGGGAHPVAGMDFIAGGASPVFPQVIGIPGSVALDNEGGNKINDFFKFIIAGFKE